MIRRYREDGERIIRMRGYWVRRPQATPYHATWVDHAKDTAEIVLGMVVLLSLFFGVPLLLWLIAGGLA